MADKAVGEQERCCKRLDSRLPTKCWLGWMGLVLIQLFLRSCTISQILEEKDGDNLKRQIIWAAAIGSLVPVFWSMLAFLLFNLHESIWSDIFWKAVHITCPFWYLNFPDGLDILAQPLLNAALYASVVYVWAKVQHKIAVKEGTA